MSKEINIGSGYNIYIFDPIHSELTQKVVERLLQIQKDKEDSIKKELTIFINSPGGSVYDLFSIIDTMEQMKVKGFTITTVCTGEACSAASVILAYGTVGHRYCTTNSQIMLHEVSSGAWGKIHDIEIGVNAAKRMNERLRKVYMKTIDSEKFKKLNMEHDNWFDAKQAKQMKIVDKIGMP